MTEPPGEVRDEAYRIAKVWGCVCRPTVTSWEQDAKGNVLRVSLRHLPGCNYDPGRYFRPAPPIDDEAIAESAKQMKKLRQRTTRKYNKRGD